MNEAMRDKMNQLRQAIAKYPRGQWYSPDTTPKKTNWFLSVVKGQAVGMPTVGDLVWVTKSQGAFQVVEVLKEEGEYTDKQGLARVTYHCRVISDL